MKKTALLVTLVAFALTGCGKPSAQPLPTDSSTNADSGTGGEGYRGGGGGFRGDPRAGRKERPQRPEMEE